MALRTVYWNVKQEKMMGFYIFEEYFKGKYQTKYYHGSVKKKYILIQFWFVDW